MPLYAYYALFAVILIGGAIATMMIGFSSKNKEGNPDYDKQTKSIFKGLSLYYVISIPFGFVALIVYIVKFVM